MRYDMRRRGEEKVGLGEETIHTLIAAECDFVQHEVDKVLYARHGYIAFF